MSVCRVITAVHRPSDILGGFVLAMFIPLLLAFPPIFSLFKTYLISPLVRFQERIFSWFQKK
ncbi:MAG: hypothetical protein LBO09_02520 [Candidatus Peribacteria bacterium]|nr:hypothetical protein [Candidatus Peribacteria bacterium]